MSLPKELRYAQTHEWIRVDGDIATVGITDHAQEQLGDVVFVDLPEVGDTFEKGDEAGEIESVKAVSPLYAPISGEVVEVNEDLDETPETVNSEPYDAGWLFKLRIKNQDELGELLDASGYQQHLAEDE